jgi:Plasma-membrane choline transporter.
MGGVHYTLRYHLGSLVLGSILIPFVWPLNAFFKYVKQKIKKMHRASKKFKFWMATCTIPLIFYEHVIKYITHRNIYQVLVDINTIITIRLSF